jgi:MFS family permease
LAGIASLLCFFLKSYPLCFVIAALWGGSDTFLHINLGAIVSALFPGRVESFSVYRIFNAIGVVTTIVLNLSLTSVDYWVFLLLVTVLAMVYTMVAVNVMELKNKVGIAEVPRDEE